MKMHQFPVTVLASIFIVFPAALATAAEVKPVATEVQASASVPVTAKGVTKTRTKSNNSNDAVAPVPAEPGAQKDGAPKTKSNIKND